MPCSSSSGPSPSPSPDDMCNEKSLRIKHEDDTSLLSKETSKSNLSSFRLLYYGDVSSTSAVPFTWETRPGTPKHPAASHQNNSSCINIPPPPSYYTSNQLLYRNSSSSSSSRSKLLLHALFRRMNPVKKSHFIPSSPSSSSSLSSLSNLSSSPQHYSSNSSSDSTIGKPGYGVHRSCLGNINNTNNIGNYKEKRQLRLHSVLMLKKAFLSIVARGSGST